MKGNVQHKIRSLDNSGAQKRKPVGLLIWCCPYSGNAEAVQWDWFWKCLVWSFKLNPIPWWLRQWRICQECRRPRVRKQTNMRPRNFPESGRFPGGGNGNSLQYSSLESSMDRGNWWATVHCFLVSTWFSY